MAEQLWAPWRFDYVSKVDSQPQGGCIFVDLPAQDNDRENLILHRGETAFVMMNAFPYTGGHLLVAPYRHVSDLLQLNDQELLEINRLLAECTRWLTHAFSPDGFNIGVNLGRAGGAGIPSHVHWHVVPRWSGDTNFMTATAGTRVIPLGLDRAYELILEAKNAE
ncbi:MAG: HIT domain-containing protein [Fimbriimonadaceae bacterium]|nr:HIT domain-containing protein [Fimbriimonadaceae bacterium]